ncbi:CDP-glycerol:poly(glycerophosphate) glycerophosphotransferase [Ketogulonicigenium robustum]|uniref:CDP-glycerol:poly(Glycerophosphate) glycerophosphotransferase n=1 Tax=Ketogulonicigenium robustum TaxID=92947 RepID=A0A1W6P1T9_9RHOB|nr:glycosyltransferase family 2 protein [Ketogulonicigenium robustum]ARO15478.1 CDP-glycerol:poly(glycerophosphate) glycerophosphotransferase [Ketogulonicigenium robustum]
MHARDIAVVIPVWNDQRGLTETLRTLRRLKMGQIIVVDDGSHPAMRAPRAQILRNASTPRGAGWARNTGLAAVTKPYVWFLDADDTLHPAAIRALLQDLGTTPFDICLFQHHEGDARPHPHDAAVWAAAGIGVGIHPVAPDMRPALAGIQNYPWNRLLRTAFLRAHGIRCSETAVHNDIRLHWHTLLAAQQVIAARHICIGHRPGRLSAITDTRRLDLHTALRETAALLPQTTAWQASFAAFTRDVLHWAHTRNPALFAAPPAAPAITGRAPIRFRLVGPHAHRTPLSYPDLQPFWRDHLQHCPTGAADLHIIAHPLDAAHAPPAPLLLLSEEPFWDLLFNPAPAAETVTLPTGGGAATIPQITHSNSAVFTTTSAAPLPYYPLTEARFAATYRQLFTANAQLAPDDWRAAWPLRRWHTALLAAHRPAPFHAITNADLRGLSAARTALALRRAGPDTLVMGTGWNNAPPRTPDWHPQKIALLNRQARVVSAIENTLQRDYLSEKLFDALACGALPLTVAPDDHAARRLGLPLAILLPPESDTDRTLPPAMARAMQQAQTRMAQLWSDQALVTTCRQRLFDALLPLIARCA